MERKKGVPVKCLLGFAAPAALLALFELLRTNRAAMDAWVFGGLEHVSRFLSFLWSWFPLSGFELCIGLVIVFHLVWIIRSIVLVVREKDGVKFLRRLSVLAALWLWLGAGLCWLWNCAYGAAGFSARSGLEGKPVAKEDLITVTRFFAERCAELSDQVARDEEGHFTEKLTDMLQRGPAVYDNVIQIFPCLEGPGRRAKPLVCSRIQSYMGFTGVYSPYTGECNINADAPACLIPATIGHEMAHQRMIANETEANFVGVAACITSDDVLFQYSGYLMGLIHLCNALHGVDQDAWWEISGATFTPELSTDWNDNNAYWNALKSPVEEAATSAYDGFLKDNHQELGMASYGACVDLLVAFVLPQIQSGEFVIR